MLRALTLPKAIDQNWKKTYSLCLLSYQLPSLLQKAGKHNNSDFKQGKLRTKNKYRKVYASEVLWA